MSGTAQNFDTFKDYLPSHFNASNKHSTYILAGKIKALYPEHQHMIVLDNAFPLSSYLIAQEISYKVNDEFLIHSFNQALNKIVPSVKIGVVQFTRKEVDFILYKVVCPDDRMGSITMNVLIFPGEGQTREEREKIGEELLTAAYKWNLDVVEEMWIFADGCWKKDKKLWDAIQLSTWDDLVLDPEFSSGLKRDTETFFSSKDIYESLGITWKRGLLLLGESYKHSLICVCC